MRIWFQKHTIKGRLPALDAAYEAHVRKIAGPHTIVDFHSLPDETYQASLPERYVRYAAVESLFASYFALQAIRAERQGYDAYVIGTSQDPGLADARAWVDIPVLGYGEAAAHTAAMLGQRFAFVGFIPELAEPIAANMRRYGLAERLVPFVPIAGGPASIEAALTGSPDAHLDAFRQAARAAAAAGAEVIIPGEGLTNEVLFAAGVREVDGVAIVDANGLLVRMAEFFVECRRLGVLTRPQVGYYNRRPGREHIMHLLKLFAPRTVPLDEIT